MFSVGSFFGLHFDALKTKSTHVSNEELGLFNTGIDEHWPNMDSKMAFKRFCLTIVASCCSDINFVSASVRYFVPPME